MLTMAISVLACKSAKPAQVSSDTLPQALLWKVEGKNLSAPSYVFGTIHIIPREDFFLPVGFDDVFKKVDKVVFEIDMDEMSDMGSMMDMMGNLMMNNGMSLNKLLTPAEYAEVSAYFEKMGLPMFLLDKVKPMFLSMLAEVNMSPDDMQSDEIISYEMDLYNKANTDGLTVGGLETMAYQMSLFDSIPYKDQALMLLEAVRGVTASDDSFDEIVDLYKHQNIEGMVSMMDNEGGGDFYGHADILLTNRNQNWIPLMAKKMEKGPVLFAVGAGHLGGQVGVIRLLRKEGYTVTPVSTYKPVVTKRF